MNFSGQTLEELEEDDMNGPFFLLCVHHLVKFLLVSIEAYIFCCIKSGQAKELCSLG